MKSFLYEERTLAWVNKMKAIALVSMGLFMVAYYSLAEFANKSVLVANQTSGDTSVTSDVLGVTDITNSEIQFMIDNTISGQGLLIMETAGYEGTALLDLYLELPGGFAILDTLCYPGIMCEIDEQSDGIAITVEAASLNSGEYKIAYVFYEPGTGGVLKINNPLTSDSLVLHDETRKNLINGTIYELPIGIAL